MIKEAAINVSDLSEYINRKGMIDAETMDPREMKSNRETVKIKSKRAIRQGKGEMAR